MSCELAASHHAQTGGSFREQTQPLLSLRNFLSGGWGLPRVAPGFSGPRQPAGYLADGPRSGPHRGEARRRPQHFHRRRLLPGQQKPQQVNTRPNHQRQCKKQNVFAKINPVFSYSTAQGSPIYVPVCCYNRDFTLLIVGRHGFPFIKTMRAFHYRSRSGTELELASPPGSRPRIPPLPAFAGPIASSIYHRLGPRACSGSPKSESEKRSTRS